jgi:tetratricopeptide (TPR) repeat protein
MMLRPIQRKKTDCQFTAWPLLPFLMTMMLAGCAVSPDEQFREAEDLIRKGQPEVARDYFRKILADHPSHASTTLTLGVLEVQSGNYIRAEELLQRGLESVPDYYDGWLQLGRVQLRLEKYPDAASAMRRARQCPAPKLDPALLRQWIIETEQLEKSAKRIPAALEWIERLGPTRRDSQLRTLIDMYIEQAECWTRLGMPEKVERCWEQVFKYSQTRILELEGMLSLDRENPNTRLLLVSALHSSAKRWAVIKKKPEEMEQRLQRADKLIASLISEATLASALRAEAAAQAVELYLMRNRLDDANLWIDLALRWDPEKVEYRFSRAQLLDKQKKSEQALEEMRKLVAEPGEPCQAHWLFYIGLLRKEERLEQALHAAEKAIGLWPDNPELLFQASEIGLAMNRVEDARQRFDKLSSGYYAGLNLKRLKHLQNRIDKLESNPGPKPGH